MNSNGKFQDPYCKKEFWLNQLSTKSRTELEKCLEDFEQFINELEREFKFAMSPSRTKTCRLTLEELLNEKMRQVKNVNQRDLFR